MSDERGEDNWVDALLSAGLDDVLTAEERAELDGLLGQDAVGARAEAFEEVDAALRSLAEEPVDEARIAASLETLRDRLDWAEEAPRRFPVAFPLASSAALPLGLAAAAAAMLFFAVGVRDDPGLRGGQIEERVGETASRPEGLSDGGSEDDAMVSALGYAEWSGDLSELGLASPEDLEIVEQLELLDFLAAREAEGQG